MRFVNNLTDGGDRNKINLIFNKINPSLDKIQTTHDREWPWETRSKEQDTINQVQKICKKRKKSNIETAKTTKRRRRFSQNKISKNNTADTVGLVDFRHKQQTVDQQTVDQPHPYPPPPYQAPEPTPHSDSNDERIKNLEKKVELIMGFLKRAFR